MRSPLRRRAGAALLLLTAFAVAGCGEDPETPEPTPAPTQTTASDPDPGPAAGACYQLPYDAAIAPTSEVGPVACSEAHTSVTFAVGTVDAVVEGHLVAVDSERVQQQVSTACPDQLLRYLRATPTDLRLSMIRSIWFTPTVEESDAGASWYRCDAVLLDGTSQLAELDGDLRGALGGARTPDRFAMCGTAAPDAADFERVRCSSKHTWRAIEVVAFDEARYPGEKKVRAAGSTRCEDAAADVAEDPLAFRWGYEWPTREQWEMGQKFGRCWTTD